jgi:hypothetical protein
MIRRISPEVKKLTDWEPDDELKKLCHAALGLTADGKMASHTKSDVYVPPYTTGGKDAGNQNGARQ